MPPASHRLSEKTLRVIAITALYAMAVAVAVAFSPANGFIHPERLAELTAPYGPRK